MISRLLNSLNYLATNKRNPQPESIDGLICLFENTISNRSKFGAALATFFHLKPDKGKQSFNKLFLAFAMAVYSVRNIESTVCPLCNDNKNPRSHSCTRCRNFTICSNCAILENSTDGLKCQNCSCLLSPVKVLEFLGDKMKKENRSNLNNNSAKGSRFVTQRVMNENENVVERDIKLEENDQNEIESQQQQDDLKSDFNAIELFREKEIKFIEAFSCSEET